MNLHCICLHSSSKVDIKLRRSVKGTAPQEEWHNTCVHTDTHTHTHKYTSSPSFSSLSSMTHPTQGQRARERESEGGERGDGWESVRGVTTVERKKAGFTEETYGTKYFLTDLLFQCYANLIACFIVKVIPSKHALWLSPVPRGVSQMIPSLFLFLFQNAFLLCIAAPRLQTTDTLQPAQRHAELCSSLSCHSALLIWWYLLERSQTSYVLQVCITEHHRLQTQFLTCSKSHSL